MSKEIIKTYNKSFIKSIEIEDDVETMMANVITTNINIIDKRVLYALQKFLTNEDYRSLEGIINKFTRTQKEKESKNNVVAMFLKDRNIFLSSKTKSVSLGGDLVTVPMQIFINYVKSDGETVSLPVSGKIQSEFEKDISKVEKQIS